MKEIPIWKQAILQTISGGSAGFVEICIMHPLDLVKTRLQIQETPPHLVEKGNMKAYRGIFDCFRKMYITEGPTSFWKGILPPILAETPKRAVKFCTFEQYKRLFLFGAPSPTPLTFFCAGLGAGLTEGLFVNPFEVVKVRMQANFAQEKEAPKTWAVVKYILNKYGWSQRGLTKGLTSTLCRNGTFNCFYLGFYSSIITAYPPLSDPVYEFCRKLSLGFISGTIASCLNIPFDVAKSRIQGPQPVPGQIKYHGNIKTIKIVYKEEGILALYKGLLPKILRLGPGGAILLVIYDYLYKYLSKRYIGDD